MVDEAREPSIWAAPPLSPSSAATRDVIRSPDDGADLKASLRGHPNERPSQCSIPRFRRTRSTSVPSKIFREERERIQWHRGEVQRSIATSTLWYRALTRPFTRSTGAPG